jgi:hypothetical protein
MDVVLVDAGAVTEDTMDCDPIVFESQEVKYDMVD